MNILLWVCITQAVWPKAQALYHELSEVEFQPPKPLRNDSFFGYSITYDQMYRQLVISSPRENDIGEVYECDIENLNCTRIVKNIVRVSDSYKHDYWFGATVKAGPKSVVMCAPRYAGISPTYNSIGAYGQCYSYSEGHLTQLKPIDPRKRALDSPKPFEATMDSFGWSIDVAFDDSIIVGGPGMFTGRAMIYKPYIPTPLFILSTAHTSTFNFGYGVSSGTFINNELSYAVSSTYGKVGFGGVTFFKDVSWQQPLVKKVDLDVVGSMFGAVLCAAKLTGKRMDLLVGAPTYAGKSTYNIGAVYVYIALKVGKSPTHIRTIRGKESGSLFGSAIISLGDLNGDKKDEVAISAPFENEGRGAVYLYSGADLISEKTEKTLTWLQKIEPKSSVAYGHSFGLSLTPLLDYDGNGCNELAIGAPYKDTVVLLKCMAAVTVKLFVSFPNLQNRTLSGKTDFVFKACLSVEYPMKPKTVIANILTTVEMSHPHAKLTNTNANGTYSFLTSLHERLPEYCSDVNFTLPLNGNYDTEINYQMSSSLQDSPLNRRKFESSRVLLSDRSILTLQDSLWAAECSGNKECVPNLHLKDNFSFHNGYIIGSSNKEVFDISLFNSGEVAYDACVRVRVVGALVFHHSPACVREPSTDGDRLLCAPAQPLRTSGSWSTEQIILEMSSLTNLDHNITIDTFLYNRCKDDKFAHNSTVIFLKSDPNGIIFNGITNIGDIVNMTKSDIQYDGKQMEHVYTILNRGPTNWIGLQSTVTLQKKPYIRYDPKSVSMYIGNAHSECEMAANLTDVLQYTCRIDSFMVKKKDIKIIIPMFVEPGTLDGILEENNNVTINSSVILSLENIDNTKLTDSIITTIQLKDAEVPLWVIIVSALLGLVILFIIAFALYECGFLRRKNKENLKELQRSVKRQTIRRSMMLTQSQAADRRQILGRMNEENEGDHNEAAST